MTITSITSTAGRRVLATAARVLTMVAGAGRLGDNTIGLAGT
jgi:hypothetical protein